jgi:hypothetical protein
MKSSLLQAALVASMVVGMAAPAFAYRHDHYHHYHGPYYHPGYVYAPPPVVYGPPPPPPVVATPSLNFIIPLHIR